MTTRATALLAQVRLELMHHNSKLRRKQETAAEGKTE